MNNLSEKKYKVVTFIVLVAVICAGIANVVMYFGEKVIIGEEPLLNFVLVTFYGIAVIASRMLLLRTDNLKIINIVNLILSVVFFTLAFFAFFVSCSFAVIRY